MRFLGLALAIALAAACAPCVLACQSDLECGEGFYCLNNSACLPDCLRCNGQCVDTFSNCGGCGAPCATGQVCLLALPAHCANACNPGTTNCNGSCYNLTNDSFHCSDCNKACARGEICKNSVCTKVDTCQ